MGLFDLSSSQKMLLFSEINNPHNDSFYLKFRKDYGLEDFENVKLAIETISQNYLNLQIKKDDSGDFKQHYVDIDVTVETFEISEEKLGEFIKNYLDKPFDDIFDSPLYKWAVLKTNSSCVLIGVVQHILLDGTSIYSIVPKEIEKCIEANKNNEKYVPIDYSYETYVNAELDYLKSDEASDDKQYWLDTLKNYSQDWYSFDDSQLGYLEVIFEKTHDFGYSPFVTALALNFLYLSKSKKDNRLFKDLILNTSVHGRYFGQGDALGMFVNTIPLRLEYDEELTFDDLLAYSKSVLKEGLGHAKLQFSEYTTDLRNVGIDPDCISMISIVSNSTDYGSKFLTLQKDIKFPLHFRINKNYSDKNGLQAIFIEYDKSCFDLEEIESIATGIKDLLKQVSEDSSKKCRDYDVGAVDFFKAENYYNNLINSFDNSTSISPDVSLDEAEFEVMSKAIDVEKLNDLSSKYKLSKDRIMLALFLFNLTKFSFSKDILISYNKLACGYHFNTDLAVGEYLTDFNTCFKEYPNYPLLNNQKLNFESEILFFTDKYSNKDYKFVFNFEDANLNIKYDASYYSKELIGAFLNGFNVLIDKFNSNDELLKNISIRKEIELDEDFKIELENEGVINKIFENIALENPDKTILYAEDGELTYDELNKKANRIANSLIKRGVGVEDKVMFMMRRNSDLIAAVLGIVKAGAAFIPIDPKYPKNRVTQILEDSDSKFVITSSDIEYTGENKIDVDILLAEKNDQNPEIELTPDNLCFLIYTSGSTGKPKGVMITHKGISNYIANVKENLPIYRLNHDCNKFISISTVSFIVFLREIFGTILNGLPVVFANDEDAVDPFKLSKLFNMTDADGFGSTPTRLLEYLQLEEIQEAVKRCKIIIVGGEGFPPVLYDRLSKFTDAEIYNSYGPTEVTIASHYKLIDSTTVTAGWPMLNVVDKVMDIDGNQLPPYVSGEIYVGGAGIARGYLNNPEQTEKVFMELNNIPYYNTGDLGKKDGAGELYVLGRNDTQIKLRGLRIELSEIEGAIANYENIVLSNVVVKTLNSVEHLCAYFTATCDIDLEDLKRHLTDSLPEYMVPSYFTQLEEFPKTPNGKTDFKNLPDPEINVDDFIKPHTETEKEIFDIVANLLGIDDFGINTNLFNIGLTSLSVIKLSAELLKKFDLEINVVDIINAKNIAEIAKLVDNCDKEDMGIEDENYELTPNQLGVYFECIRNPDNTSYNLPKKISFNKNIDAVKLRDSIIKAIDLYPFLKNRIIIDGAKVLNHKYESIGIDEIDIEEINEVTPEVISDFVKPFDIIDNQLFRFKIYVTPSNTVLLSDFHHLIVDGTSLNVLFNDISAIYDGDEDRISNVGADTYEYISKENNYKLSENNAKSEKFFDDMLCDFDENTVLTTNLTGDEENANLAVVRSKIGKDIVEEFCNRQKISPNILFMSSTVLTLSKYVSNKDILISTLFNGRNNPKYQNTIGMLVKTIPIAFKTDRDMDIRKYFEFVNNSWLNVLNHSSYNYVEIANKYELSTDFLYAFHGKIIEDVSINGEKYPRESIDHDLLSCKISLNVIEVDDDYEIFIEYNDELYTEEYVSTFTNSIITIIKEFIANGNGLSDIKLKDIAIVPEDSGIEFEDIDVNVVHRLFENRVKEHPDKTALISCDGEFTYDELNRKANRVAHALIKRGVKIGDKVLHMLPRTSNILLATLGILKSGATFIPLANDYPEERVEYIRGNCQAKWIISDNDFENAIRIDDLLNESLDESNPDLEIPSDNLAYMIYTSGSTGNPKGVMVTHNNVSNFLVNDARNLTYSYYRSVERVLSLTTVSFDASILDLLGTMSFGNTLIFASDSQTKDVFELVDLIKRTKPELLDTTPSRLLQFLEFDGFEDFISNFKIFTIGGEKFSVELFDALEEFPCDLYNAYGPTETTVQSNVKKIDRKDKISVGKALYPFVTDVRDIDGKLLPDGVVGELYIGGPCVTKGYYNNPEKTAEVYTTINNIPYYRSGDYAYKFDDEIYILGRIDNQIKLRGLRIEPDEISNVISQYGPIISSIVVIKKINGIEHLCAYYTASEKIDVDDLKANISNRLTPYMVPTAYMQLDAFPQTANGKTDIRNLPEPELTLDYVAPENEVEAFFAKSFEEILGIDKVGVTNNFFEIGGTSLLVTKVTINAINNGYDINYGDLFANPTPRQLAEFIASDDKAAKNEIGDYDYTLIDNLLVKNNIKNFFNESCSDSLGNVLLTGATGFLGIHILRELLENDVGNIYCLVRSKGNLSGEDRLKSLLYYYFSTDYDDYFHKRLHIVDGDITDFEDFKKLIPYDINTIINSAANVKHFSSGTDIEDINYGGVLNGLEFAKLKKCKYVQISTVSTAGESINNYPPEDRLYCEQDLYIGQSVDNQYLGSKFLAERAVLQAACDDQLDVKIMRVGNLMARTSDSEFQINFSSNGFINRLKSFVTVGKFPYALLNNNFELSQIDITAKSIVELSKTPKNCVVFHPYNNHFVTYADILNIFKSLDIDIEIVDQEEYERTFKEVMKDESKQAGLSGFITSIGEGKEKKIWVKDENDYTIQVSHLLGINWPLISEEYIYNFIKFLKDLEFFD